MPNTIFITLLELEQIFKVYPELSSEYQLVNLLDIDITNPNALISYNVSDDFIKALKRLDI
jgi:hypothetical protein